MIKKILISTAAVFLIAFAAAFCIFPLPGQVPVLMYHFIGTDAEARESKNYVSRSTFEKQMAFLHYGRYRVISLAEYEEIRQGKRKPRGREIAITFDDGDISFLTEAMPVLNKYRFPVTIFGISSQLENSPEDRISQKLMKSILRHDWVSLQSHTKTHPALASLKDEEIRAELVDSKRELEEMFGRPIDYVAYPLGNIDGRVIKEAEKAGYRLAFTTSYKKLKDLPEGPFSIQREKISRTSDNPLYFWVKISGFYSAVKRYRYQTFRPKAVS